MYVQILIHQRKLKISISHPLILYDWEKNLCGKSIRSNFLSYWHTMTIGRRTWLYESYPPVFPTRMNIKVEISNSWINCRRLSAETMCIYSWTTKVVHDLFYYYGQLSAVHTQLSITRYNCPTCMIVWKTFFLFFFLLLV